MTELAISKNNKRTYQLNIADDNRYKTLSTARLHRPIIETSPYFHPHDPKDQRNNFANFE